MLMMHALLAVADGYAYGFACVDDENVLLGERAGLVVSYYARGVPRRARSDAHDVGKPALRRYRTVPRTA